MKSNFIIKSPFKYFPIKVGKYNLTYDDKNKEYTLFEKYSSWMGYDTKTHWQACEFYIELAMAQGVCITTGLGLGIIQAHLCQKENVTKVIVYEKSDDVLEIFYRIVDYNKFDISKIEIRKENADQISGQVCDCLFPDHFSSESDEYVISVVRNLAQNNQANLVWYWPAGLHFIKFALRKNLEISNQTYQIWKTYTGINNLPELNDEMIDYIVELKNLYKTATPNSYGGIIKSLEAANTQKKGFFMQSKKYKENIKGK